RLCKDRRRAGSGNADDERGTVDDGSEREVTMGRLVDDIDGNAGGARGVGEASRVAVVIEAGDGNGSAAEILRLPRPMLQHDGAARRLRGQSVKLLAWTLGKHQNVGAGGRKQLR